MTDPEQVNLGVVSSAGREVVTWRCPECNRTVKEHGVQRGMGGALHPNCYGHWPRVAMVRD